MEKSIKHGIYTDLLKAKHKLANSIHHHSDGLVMALALAVILTFLLSTGYVLTRLALNQPVPYMIYTITVIGIAIIACLTVARLAVGIRFKLFSYSLKLPKIDGFGKDEYTIYNCCYTHLKMLGIVKEVEEYSIYIDHGNYEDWEFTCEQNLRLAVMQYRRKCRNNLELLDRHLKSVLTQRGFNLNNKKWKYTFSERCL